MEGKGPYRIYDPGGSEVRAREEAGGGSSYRQLLEENSKLRERMKGLKSLGRLLKTVDGCCRAALEFYFCGVLEPEGFLFSVSHTNMRLYDNMNSNCSLGGKKKQNKNVLLKFFKQQDKTLGINSHTWQHMSKYVNK